MIEKFRFKELKSVDSKTKVIRAAVKVNQDVYTGWCHTDIILYLKRYEIAQFITPELKGFITNDLEFATRAEASKIAFEAGQTPILVDNITSEHLWRIPND